jgi:hypothetical protein
VDFNKLIARAKAILLTPKTEWPVIANEPTTAADLYKGYIVILAAVPVIFAFIKWSIIGVSVPFAGTMRIGMGLGLTQMLISYVLSLAMVYVLALIIDALAPSFGGQKDQIQALKTAAYAYTASWVAGVAQILPWLGMLIMIAGGIYSIYLLYLGLPNTMKAPNDKAVGYTVVVIIVGIVMGIVVGMVTAAITGTGAAMSGAFSSSQDADVQFDKDSPMGKLEQWSKNVEQASKQMEAAQKSGDQDAQADAMKSMMGAALGGGDVEALAPDRLKPFLPETLMGMQRGDMSAERNGAMGMQISEARAAYTADGRSVTLQITDTGSAKGLLGLANWAGVEGERQDGDSYEKTYRQDGRLIHEEWDGTRGEYTIVLGDRFTVQLNGEGASIDDLKAALSDLDLGSLEALKNEGVKAN